MRMKIEGVVFGPIFFFLKNFRSDHARRASESSRRTEPGSHGAQDT